MGLISRVSSRTYRNVFVICIKKIYSNCSKTNIFFTMSYQPFENEPETIQSTTNLDDAYPEMDPEAQKNNAGNSNNSVNRNYQSSKGDVLVTCCGRPFHSRSIAVLFIFFNLVVHIMNYGRSWRKSIENNNSHGHNYDPTLNEETSSAANIEDGLIMLNHFQVWLEAFLS